MKLGRFFRQFNWRFLLVRILVNAIALAITAAILPKVYFVDKTMLNLLLMALMLGVLNALLKPILQFLTLQFIFVTYGLVIVLVNALLLWLLSVIFPNRFAAESLLTLLLGGLVLGLVSSFLESLLGLTMPIVPEEAAALRRQLGEEARHAGRLALAGSQAGPEDQVLAIESPTPEARSPGLGGAEPSASEPDEGPSPLAANDEEPVGPIVEPPTEAAAPAEAGVSVDPEPAPEPGKEQKEDGS